MRFHRNVSLVLIVVFVVLNYCVSLGFPVFFSHVEIAMRRIPVFLLGSYFAEDVKKGKTVNEIPVILLSSLCLYLSYRFLLSDECSSSIFFRYVLGVNGVSLVFILSWIMNRIGDRIHIIKKAIEYVGLYSLEFYLIYEKLVLEMKSYLNDSFINALICFILCLIIAQLISKVNRKLFS
jgi:peptidoglycan/LPS O-acetylase OafA/YrhL